MGERPVILMIADDERLERDAVEHILREAFAELTIVKAKNGREAIEMAGQITLDIALLDINMPGIDGIAAARSIKELRKETRVVFLTALSSFDAAQKAIRSGAHDYLVKPVGKRDLTNLVATLLDAVEQERREEGPVAIQKVLTEFNRSIFIAIKHGTTGVEGLRSYLSLTQIQGEQGISMVLHTARRENLLRHLEALLTRYHLQSSFFPAPDRVSLIVFFRNREKVEHLVASLVGETVLEDLHIGLSQVFLSLEEIPSSISQASAAYTLALHTGQRIVRFDTEVEEALRESATKESQLENELKELILAGDILASRQKAHEVLDTLRVLYPAEDQNSLVHTLHDSIIYITKAVTAQLQIPALPLIPKSTVAELERILMDFIDSTCRSIDTTRKDKYSQQFAVITEYIQAHYHSELTLEAMAQKAGITPSYFSRLFKDYAGTSFVAYIAEVRIEAAKKMMTLDYTMQSIAASVGYRDYRYFSRVFRTHTGFSPKEYRRRIQESRSIL